MKSIGVIGLGYVGLALARHASQAGIAVHGVDISQDILDALSADEAIFASLSLQPRSADCLDAFIVCVPTPINEDKTPNLTYVDSALDSVGSVLRPGQLVVLESTVFPGYYDNVGIGILESSSGLIAGKDFYFAHCPERVDPGNDEWTISNIPRVIGGIDQASVRLARKLYSKITSGELHVVSNISEAEASKMIENTFRDVNIAFVNEMAKSFDGTNIDIYRVLRACATKPFGYMPFVPGLGVGGHCIPVDPYYLIDSASNRGFTHSLLRQVRDINNSMVDYIAEKIEKYATESDLKDVRIGIFGLAYKPNVPDVRESQSMRLLMKLRSQGFAVRAYDPFVKSEATTEQELFGWANVVVTAVAHDAFANFEKKINFADNIYAVFDTGNMLNADNLRKEIIYRGIGR